MKLGLSLLFCALFSGFTFSTLAQSVTLGWAGSASPNIAEYALHYGTVPGIYTYTNDVGLATNATVSNLQAGTTYYFAVTDFDTIGLQSISSGQISYSVPGSGPSNS